uniref:Death ligand signal enhancer n=1 Tax=Salvator merianae TaxID=96440 RepID=A0A8D0EDW8_SALMN
MLWRLLWILGRGVRASGAAAGSGPGPGRAAAGLIQGPVVSASSFEEYFLPSSSQDPAHTNGRWNGGYRKHKGCRYGNILHCYIPLDAFTWSALAVLALELAKQIQWWSSKRSGVRVRFCQLDGQFAVLPQHQHSVICRNPSICSSAEDESSFLEEDNTSYELTNAASGNFLPSVTNPEPESHSAPSQSNLDEESVSKAASQMQHVFQTSISVASNILGLENMKDERHRMAFSCFKLAADQNYSKAQFNVGLCYEHGRGTKKSVAKAVLYYQRAAHQGHVMAQYHYAKWLLCHHPKVDDNSKQEAVHLLNQAATAGLKQAQAYLRVLYVTGIKAKKQSIQKKMSKENGDFSSRLHLGICYEENSGVPWKLLTIRKRYQQAATASFKTVQELMKETAENITAMQSWQYLPLATRTFSSSPCLQSFDQPLISSLGQPALGLFHSWSTGSLKDMANRSVSCLPSIAFPDHFSVKLSSLAWSPSTGIAID